jgi:hypothetical protein
MNARRIFLLLLILLLIWMMRPGQVWQEGKRIWSQRELVVRLLVIMIGLYFAYGVYELYNRGWLDWIW